MSALRTLTRVYLGWISLNGILHASTHVSVWSRRCVVYLKFVEAFFIMALVAVFHIMVVVCGGLGDLLLVCLQQAICRKHEVSVVTIEVIRSSRVELGIAQKIRKIGIIRAYINRFFVLPNDYRCWQVTLQVVVKELAREANEF